MVKRALQEEMQIRLFVVVQVVTDVSNHDQALAVTINIGEIFPVAVLQIGLYERCRRVPTIEDEKRWRVTAVVDGDKPSIGKRRQPAEFIELL